MTPPRPTRIHVVEYLRGLASLAVCWFHLTGGYEWGPVRMSGARGHLGVAVFFVISGFIIPYSIASQFERYRARDYPAFIARRILRLEPPYVLSIALTILLGYLSGLAPGFRGGPMEIATGQVLAHFLYLIPLTHYDWMQPVYWTLAYEFAYYLFIGLAFGVLCGPQSKSWVWLIFSAGLAGAVILGVAPFLLMLFVMGVGVYRRLVAGDPLWVTLSTLVIAGAALALRGEAVFAAVGLATAFVLWGWRSVELKGLAGQFLGGLAAISYSLYLTHVIIGGRVINLGKRFIHGQIQELLLSLLALLVCLLVATAFWWAVERPAIRLARGVNRRPAHRVAEV